MSSESWKLLLEIIALGGVAISVFAGAGALILGNRINKSQAAEIRGATNKTESLRLDLATEQGKVAGLQKDASDARAIQQGVEIQLGKQQERAARAELEVEGAKKLAAEASRKAEGFRLDIAKAQEKAAEADAKAEQFRANIAESDRKAAEATHAAEQEKLARIKIEQRLAFRGMGSDEERAEIVKALNPYRGTSVRIVRLGEMEAHGLASDIAGLLTDAGWNVTFTEIGTLSPPKYGVMCTFDPNTPTGKAFDSTFKKASINNHFSMGFQYAPGKPDVDIFVALKPPL